MSGPAAADVDAGAAGYAPVEYLQFRPSSGWRMTRAVAGILTWPLVLPLALLARLSDIAFRTVSEMLSQVPYALGIVMRAEFYRFTLRRCGRNVIVEFGTIFCYRDVALGDHVLLGRFNVIHHCDFGSYVLVGEHCTFLSGSRQHGMEQLDRPMALQQGFRKRIHVADDVWIGAHTVLMEDVSTGAVVGAGSVVNRPVEPYAIVAGNPARLIRRRDQARPAL